MSEESIIPLTMPKWGLSMKEGKFVSWLIDEGQAFNKGDELAEVETEKIASAVEASMSGVLRKAVAETDVVYPVGALIGVIADPSISDADIDAFIEEFQSNYVPPADDEEEAGSQSEFTDVDGIRLRYVSKGEGDETLFLLHGFGGDIGNWMFNHDELVEKTGARVIAVDLPGHGESGKNVQDGSLEGLAKIILGLMTNLEIQKAHFAGHSMSGAVILQLLDLSPDSVKTGTLISPAGLDTSINAAYLDGFINGATRKAMKPVLQLLFADPELVNRQLINGILQFKRLDGVDAALKTIRDAFLDGTSQRVVFDDVLKTHAGKLQLVWGKHDHIMPLEHAEKWQDTIATSIFDDTGHMSHLEASSQVNTIITERMRQ